MITVDYTLSVSYFRNVPFGYRKFWGLGICDGRPSPLTDALGMEATLLTDVGDLVGI